MTNLPRIEFVPSLQSNLFEAETNLSKIEELST